MTQSININKRFYVVNDNISESLERLDKQGLSRLGDVSCTIDKEIKGIVIDNENSTFWAVSKTGLDSAKRIIKSHFNLKLNEINSSLLFNF